MTLSTLIKNSIGSGVALISLSFAVAGAIVQPANANTITFSNLDTDRNAFTGSQTEDGFTYTVTSGLNFILARFSFSGNPPSSLGVGFGTIESLSVLGGGESSSVVAGGQIEFTRTGGGLFTFDSFQLATSFFRQSSVVSWTGQVNGVNTQSLTGVSTTNQTFSTQNVNFTASIDKLILTFTDFDATTNSGLFLDNLQFTPAQDTPSVPEPGTILGLVTVGALGALSRKRKG